MAALVPQRVLGMHDLFVRVRFLPFGAIGAKRGCERSACFGPLCAVGLHVLAALRSRVRPPSPSAWPSCGAPRSACWCFRCLRYSWRQVTRVLGLDGVWLMGPPSWHLPSLGPKLWSSPRCLGACALGCIGCGCSSLGPCFRRSSAGLAVMALVVVSGRPPCVVAVFRALCRLFWAKSFGEVVFRRYLAVLQFSGVRASGSGLLGQWVSSAMGPSFRSWLWRVGSSAASIRPISAISSAAVVLCSGHPWHAWLFSLGALPLGRWARVCSPAF